MTHHGRDMLDRGLIHLPVGQRNGARFHHPAQWCEIENLEVVLFLTFSISLVLDRSWKVKLKMEGAAVKDLSVAVVILNEIL